MSKYLIVALVVLLGMFYAYFKITQDKIEFLNQEITTLNIANERNQQTINTMKVTAEQNAERNRALQANLEKAEAGLNTLRRTLQEHDLTRLAAKKPGLIEPRMQGATNELFENFFNTNTDPVSP
jgi:uncharacterized protein HemX